MSIRPDAPSPKPLPSSPELQRPAGIAVSPAQVAERCATKAPADAFSPDAGTAGNTLQGASAVEPVIPSKEVFGATVDISSNDDDPTFSPSNVEQLPLSAFTLDESGKPVGLEGPKVKLNENPFITQQNQETGAHEPVATNPWSLPKPNEDGNFVFPDEPRIPGGLQVKRDEDGNPIEHPDGLINLAELDTHQAQTTVFEALNTVAGDVEAWAGRGLAFGQDGQITASTHAYVGLNAHYSPAPADRGLHFGIVPYETPDGERHLFEMASTWEVAAHEMGHALHHSLKPGIFGRPRENATPEQLGYGQWGESFGDQLAMWSSLKDPERLAGVLEQNGGDFSKQSGLTHLMEGFAQITGQEGQPLRDHINDKTVENTPDQVHDRGQVLTGASYDLFQDVVAGFEGEGLTTAEAAAKAADVMGTFLVRAADHTPENLMTFDKVGQAYLKVDQEHFGGKYREAIVEHFTDRGILNDASIAQFEEHESFIPEVSLEGPATAEKLQAISDGLLDPLEIPADLGLNLADFQTTEDGWVVARFELTEGRGPDAEGLSNHARLTFRPDGSLADWQGPLAGLAEESEESANLGELLREARELGLDAHGTLGFVPDGKGGITVGTEAHVGGGDPHLVMYDLANPAGIRGEYQQTHDHGHDGHGHGRYEGAVLNALPEGSKILTLEEYLA